MLKKVSKLSMLFCMLALAGSVFAQKEVPEYPQYGFWSNWSIGATISFDYQPDVKQFYGVEKPFWGGGFNAGTGIVGSPAATKDLTRTRPLLLLVTALPITPSPWTDTVPSPVNSFCL